MGGKIVYEEETITNNDDFKTGLTKIKEMKVDLIFIPVYEQLAARILNMAWKSNFDSVHFLGADGWLPRNIFSDIVIPKDLKFQLYWSSHFHENYNSGQALDFHKKFTKKFNKEPSTASVMGYDCVQIIGKILELTSAHPTQDEFVKVMNNFPEMVGISGPIKFYKGEQGPRKPVYIKKLVGQKSVNLKEYNP